MKEVLKIFETTMKQEVQSICIFPGGFSNNNYLINNDYIMRRKKIYIQPFYDSICEKGIEEFLKDKNITIPCYYIDDKGTKITPYIRNGVRLLKNSTYLDHIKLIARKLKALHSIDYKCEKNFSYFDRVVYYREEAFVHKHPLEEEIITLYNKYINGASANQRSSVTVLYFYSLQINQRHEKNIFYERSFFLPFLFQNQNQPELMPVAHLL